MSQVLFDLVTGLILSIGGYVTSSVLRHMKYPPFHIKLTYVAAGIGISQLFYALAGTPGGGMVVSLEGTIVFIGAIGYFFALIFRPMCVVMSYINNAILRSNELDLQLYGSVPCASVPWFGWPGISYSDITVSQAPFMDPNTMKKEKEARVFRESMAEVDAELEEVFTSYCRDGIAKLEEYR